MFLGYQDDIIVIAAETEEELQNIPCLRLTKIEKTKKEVEFVGGVYRIGKKDIQEAKNAIEKTKEE